jgi:hypothetical protein
VFLIDGASHAAELVQAMGDESMSEQDVTYVWAALDQVYGTGFTEEDLASHPGVIFVPNIVGGDGVHVYYDLNIPILAPSIEYLLEMHARAPFLQAGFDFGGESEAPPVGVPSPTGSDTAALAYWLQLSEVYLLPHILLFDSAQMALQLLKEAPLQEISAKMQRYNQARSIQLQSQMKHVLHTLNISLFQAFGET